ncbi:MAG: cytochrome c [Burkholderiales bacterium]|nr:cytochrome c [Phycisphaerae bacterium]
MASRQAKPQRLINGRFPSVPFWMRALALTFISLSLLVAAGVLRSRGAMMHEPRVHFVQDMDNQVKLKTQHKTDVFADGRASRPQVPGTVAMGQLNADDHLFRGFTATWNVQQNKYDSTFLDGIPVKVDEALLKRGQLRFNTYCMPCHGYTGQGVGPVAARADKLQRDGVAGMLWTAPSNLTDELRRGRPDGHIYNTIVNGIRNMGPYGASIQNPTDRWAIVAYVRALQVSAPVAKPAAATPQAAVN